MQKGDRRKQEILDTAENLFCKNGYEKTSIQDILDILHLSKGSFYHHFESKETVLEAICTRNIDQSGRKIEDRIFSSNSTTEQIDLILSDMMPFSDEKLNFIKMLLPVLVLSEGRSVTVCYQSVLHDRYYNILKSVIEDGISKHIFFCDNPAVTTDICINLINDLWYRLCAYIQQNITDRTAVDTQILLDTVDAYRNATENILSAPYGSIHLLNLEKVILLGKRINGDYDA